MFLLLLRLNRVNPVRRAAKVFRSIPLSYVLFLPFIIFIIIQIVLINRIKHWNDNEVTRVDRTEILNLKKIPENVKKSAATTTTPPTTTTTTKPSRFFNLNDSHAIGQLERLEESLKNSFDKIDSPTDWSSLVPLNGGRPLQILILSSWKTGSTLLADFLSAHPATYLHYEPFSWYGMRRMRKQDQVYESAVTISDLFSCNYQQHLAEHRMDYLIRPEMLNHNHPLWDHCRRLGWRVKCLRPEFLNNFCSLFPIQVMKILRLGPNVTEFLMQDANLSNLKIIVLTRDPRNTMLSRWRSPWCRQNTDCEDLQQICSDMTDDFYATKKMKTDFPNNVMALRFEDFLHDTDNSIGKLLDFVGFKIQKEMKAFLTAHRIGTTLKVADTKKENGNPVQRRFAPIGDRQQKKTDLQDSATGNSFQGDEWQRQLDSKQVKIIQSQCSKAMSLWGYKLLDSSVQQDNFDSKEVLKI